MMKRYKQVMSSPELGLGWLYTETEVSTFPILPRMVT